MTSPFGAVFLAGGVIYYALESSCVLFSRYAFDGVFDNLTCDGGDIAQTVPEHNHHKTGRDVVQWGAFTWLAK